MTISGRHLLLVLCGMITAAGALLWIDPQSRWLALVIATCGMLCLAVLTLFREYPSSRRESDDINHLSPQRRRELVRGTSLYLRELRYRYSIRLDPTESSDQRPFTAEVNSIKLGFVPVVIIDNTNDRQGFGYVAFVHDGKRWRGPGLPCPAGQVEAVRHAAKCVSPLSTEEETRF